MLLWTALTEKMTMGVTEGKAKRILAFCATAMVAILLQLLLATNPAHASTFTVTNTDDGGAGSLRQAITDANTRTGADSIKFNIPASTNTGCNATSGVCTISPSSELPGITDPVIIDGYSQPGASPNTLAVGNNAVLKIELSGASFPSQGNLVGGLKIKAANSTVKGLIINDWESGVFLDTGATANKVEGNFIGTDVTGTTDKNGTQDLGNNGGVTALGENNTIGGTKAAARNIISGNGSGVQIIGTANQVQGNYIGTKASGTEALGNSNGVVIFSENNTIGGTKAKARNIISGNSASGIQIGFSGATGNQVQGNYIGTKANGTEALGNGVHGVSIHTQAANNTIGGTKAKARNIISGNGQSGVELFFNPVDFPNGATGNRILSNSIYDNDKLGIDLVHSNDPPGVTRNDDGDTDIGPNNLQNFPDLTKAAKSGKKITIEGTLNSTANTTFIIQFFSSPAADSSGNGEGQRLIGQKSATTDGSGNASFTATTGAVTAGEVVTATATDQTTGDSSEFSEAVVVS